MNEFKLRVPSDLTRRFRGLSIDIGTSCLLNDDMRLILMLLISEFSDMSY